MAHSVQGRASQAQHTDIWGHVTLCRGVCPVHCRMFSRILGLHPLDLSGIPSPVVTTKVSPDIVKHALGTESLSGEPLVEGSSRKTSLGKLALSGPRRVQD